MHMALREASRGMRRGQGGPFGACIVRDGSIVALLGSNGAGKSTTLKAISGLLRTELGQVTDGSIDFDGQRIDRRDPVNIVHLGVVQVMEGRRVLEHLTVAENLRVGSQRRASGTTVKVFMGLSFLEGGLE